MSAFQRLRNRVASIEKSKSPSDLRQGMKYEVLKFTHKLSDFPRSKQDQSYPMMLVAHVRDPESPSKYFVYMPKAYYDLSLEDVKEFNDAIEAGKPPSIVFYGKDGARNDVILHELGESIDAHKLQGYIKTAKRPASDAISAPPTKKTFLEVDPSISTD